MDGKHRARFDEKMKNEQFSKYTLTSADDYRYVVNVLSGDGDRNNRNVKFDLVEVAGMKKVIKTRKTQQKTPRYIVTQNELFDVLLEAHVNTGHGGEKKTKTILQDKYANISGKMI
ncbi:hypothetical protein V1264_016140 [Littorina saxatilis]|uniref:Uncharacterized protein n=1 Tax=Littorina saxatilis TaxID=31220 RepID=A0AAN9GHT0_9CAEN